MKKEKEFFEIIQTISIFTPTHMLMKMEEANETKILIDNNAYTLYLEREKIVKEIIKNFKIDHPKFYDAMDSFNKEIISRFIFLLNQNHNVFSKNDVFNLINHSADYIEAIYKSIDEDIILKEYMNNIDIYYENQSSNIYNQKTKNTYNSRTKSKPIQEKSYNSNMLNSELVWGGLGALCCFILGISSLLSGETVGIYMGIGFIFFGVIVAYSIFSSFK